MIYRKDEFIQDDRDDTEFPIKQIDRLQELGGDKVRFIGHAMLNMETPVGPQQIPIAFDIEADSIEAAFASFAGHARPRLERARRRVEQWLADLREKHQGKIVTPGTQTPAPNIINLEELKGPD